MTYLERQIARAVARSMDAKQDSWSYAWADLACRLMRERRNSPTRDRESEVGVASSGWKQRGRLGKQFTTALTNGSRRVA